MADCAAADEGLCYLVHFDCRLHPGIDALFLERVLQSERVNHSCQHAHVIGGNAVHVARLLRHSAKEVAAAYHDGNLDSQRMHVGEFSGNLMNPGRLNSESLTRGQRFPREFEKDAFKDWGGHMCLHITRCSPRGEDDCPALLPVSSQAPRNGHAANRHAITINATSRSVALLEV